MTRSMTSAAIAAVQQEVVARTLAVELLFDDGAVRLVGASVPITIDGEEFIAVGGIFSASAIEETAELSSSGMTIGLSGLPTNSLAIALGQPYQGRPAKVWEVWLDRETGLPIDAPCLFFAGRIDQMNGELGSSAAVEVTLEDHLTDMDRANLARYTDEDQQRDHPGDLGFAFVSAVVEKEIVWPAASFRQ